jgi:hypothetical protein
LNVSKSASLRTEQRGKAHDYVPQEIDINRSKVHHMWRIEVDGKEHKIELLVSYVSGMKRVLKDGFLLYEKQM